MKSLKHILTLGLLTVCFAACATSELARSGNDPRQDLQLIEGTYVVVDARGANAADVCTESEIKWVMGSDGIILLVGATLPFANFNNPPVINAGYDNANNCTLTTET
ncbi:MAG: hypothetical protein V4736_04580, partial [Bdellovibrionota bacterium]